MANRKSTNQQAPEAQATEPAAQDDPIVREGRLTRDPQLRRTAKGLAVCNIRLAINQPDSETNFQTCVCWGRTAENVARYLKKGRLVQVTGREVQRSWTGRDGEQRTETELNAFRVHFGGSQTEAPDSDKQVA